jgi:hypothetical protein
MKVFIYRNLNRKGRVFSIRDESTRRVCDRAETVVVEDVTLKVSEAGRNRVLLEKRKNVHAGIQGTRISHLPPQAAGLKVVEFTYDPYFSSSFFCVKTKQPILKAKYVEVNTSGNFAYV